MGTKYDPAEYEILEEAPPVNTTVAVKDPMQAAKYDPAEYDIVEDAPNVKYSKHFVPSGDEGRGTTEMIGTSEGKPNAKGEIPVSSKLIGPVESGNTTGRDPLEYVKAKFKAPPGADDKSSVLGSIIRKYVQGLTSDTQDEGIGGLTAGKENVPGQYLTLPDGTEVPATDNVDQYTAGRDFERQKMGQADKQLGKLGMIPQVAGAATQYVLGKPAFDAVGKVLTPATQGMGAVRTAANVAGANAVVPSAMNAVGSSTADVTKGEIPQAVGEAALGTVMGVGGAGLLGGGLAALGLGSEKIGLSDWIKKKAGEYAEKARDVRDWGFYKTLDTGKKAFKEMDHLDTTGDVAQFAFDKDLMSRFSTAKDVAAKASALRASRGADVGAAKDAADALATPDQLPNVGETLAELRALRASYERKPGYAKVLPQLDAQIDAIEASLRSRAGANQPADPRVSFRDHEGDFKAPFDETISWGEDKFGQKAAKDARGSFMRNTEKKMTALDPALAETFKAAKSDVGNAAAIEGLANNATINDMVRRKMSPSDNAFGLAGLATGMLTGNAEKGLAYGAGFAGLNHAGRVYGPGLIADAANKTFKAADSVAKNGLPLDEIAKALSASGRPVTQETVNDFIAWIKSKGGGQ